MEKIRNKRKRLSVITLIFFISMMLFDNAVFASADCKIKCNKLKKIEP